MAMVAPEDLAPPGSSHEFGGDWTTQKLEVLRKYLSAYATALKNQPSKERPFKRWYIDAFAGTGYRQLRRAGPESTEPLLFPDLAGEDTETFLKGSARLALEVSPSFDRYVFVEKNRKRCAALQSCTADFPDLAKRILVREGEANEEIQKLCALTWRSDRAVLFLDPYGMQVDWATVEAIARTKAIDMWLLFPIGIGVNRLLERSGNVPLEWRRSLDRFLGTEAWYDAFYREEHQATLFGDEVVRVKVSLEAIGSYFVSRLKTIFPGVVERPGMLRSSTDRPLYMLCFAASNERGAPLATKIARRLLRDLR
jgi:three-Cys-motif partner protein